MFAFLSGNSLADTGHASFERLLDRLRQACGLDSDRMAVIRALMDFEEDLSLHLGLEEVVLRSLHYADVVRHTRLHSALLDQVHMLRDRFGIDRRQAPSDILRTLEDMLWEHALQEDSAYWDMLRGMDLHTDIALPPCFGDERLDGHHRALGKLIAMLNDESAADTVFHSILAGFRTLAAYHLRVEAALDGYGSTGVADTWLLWSLDEALAQTQHLSRRAVVDYLSDWLITHHGMVDERGFYRHALSA